MSVHRTLLTRAAAASAATVLLGVLAATTAQAHVTVKPESTTAGTFSQLTFRVPTESGTASTTKVQVSLPTTTPLLHVSVLPVPGWSFEVDKRALPKPVESYGTTITTALSSVTWTAQGDGIKPGEYQNFAISAGPLPRSGELVFPAAQTYSDGEVVEWATVAPSGAEEPDHPAPSFTVTPVDATVQSAAAAAENAVGTPAVESEDSNATTLAVVGLGVAVVALVLALVAVVRGRKAREIEA